MRLEEPIGEVVRDLVSKALEFILKVMARGVTGSYSRFRKICLITVEGGLEEAKPKQEKPARRLMGECFSR